MSSLQSELDRLYRPRREGAESGLIAPDGRVRALVLALARPADWTLLSTLWRGVQNDLNLPAPAIAVSGIDAYQLWFSLEEPVSVAQAQGFLNPLRSRYLSMVAPERLSMWPSVGGSSPGQILHAPSVPALYQATGRWSAYVAPDLAAIFSEEPWLDLPPSPEAQAKVLAHVGCIKPALFEAALERLSRDLGAEASVLTPANEEPRTCQSSRISTAPSSHENRLEPKEFLLGVMNDKGTELHLRIEAAKALLPYFEGRIGA
jgi:hypothetical protein